MHAGWGVSKEGVCGCLMHAATRTYVCYCWWHYGPYSALLWSRLDTWSNIMSKIHIDLIEYDSEEREATSRSGNRYFCWYLPAVLVAAIRENLAFTSMKAVVPVSSCTGDIVRYSRLLVSCLRTHRILIAVQVQPGEVITTWWWRRRSGSGYKQNQTTMYSIVWVEN